MDLLTLGLLLSLLALLAMSGYFSSSETAMMKLNPYRLAHMAGEGHGGARRAKEMLKRQDRLLGVILIGNNLVNNCAAVISAAVCFTWFGTAGYAIAAFATTIIFLIFAEVAPKTIAAERPESIAYPSSYILKPLHTILNPFVILVNKCASILVDPIIRAAKAGPAQLSHDEFRTAVIIETKGEAAWQAMMLRLLDLRQLNVDDIMVARGEVEGLDLAKPFDEVVNELMKAEHTRLAVYEEELDKLVGVANVRRLGQMLHSGDLEIESFKEQLQQPYFVPSGTPLNVQLQNFLDKKERFGFVVDEYGGVEGIVTLEDTLEEIVGEFTTDLPTDDPIVQTSDGKATISGQMLVRDINRELGWELPTSGNSKTLNGLILEELGDIPDGRVGVKIDDWVFDVKKFDDTGLQIIEVTPPPEKPTEDPESDETPV